MNRRAAVLAVIIVASAVLYLIGNESVALWDRDEPRYAQTSRQMLQSGDWVVPHYLDMVRTAKPVFIYWCQAAAMDAIGDNPFAARLPSAVAILLLLVILSMVLWPAIGAQRTVWTVFILATSAMTIVQAKFCLTDAVQMLWITIAQLGLYALWRGNRSWLVVISMASAVGLAGLTKGPVVFGFLLTPLLALGAMRLIDRWLGVPIPHLIAPAGSKFIILKFALAVLIVAAIVGPWMLMVQHRSAAFLKTAAWHELWQRMTTPLERHTGPPGYYLIWIWITFFPWSMMLPPAIGLAIRHRADPQIRFALAAVIGPWIMLECVRTKLPSYFLPAFPPLAFLTADALLRCLRGEHHDLQSRTFVRGIAIWATIVALLASAPWLLITRFHPLPYGPMIALSILGPLLGATVFIFFHRRRIAAGSAAMGVGTMILTGIMYGWYLPDAQFLRISPRVAQVLIDHGVTHPNQVIMMDYMEPSLAFYQGGTIREAGDLGLGHNFLNQLPPWLVVTDEIWCHATDEVREHFEVVADIHGLDYADHLRWKDVLVIHRREKSE